MKFRKWFLSPDCWVILIMGIFALGYAFLQNFLATVLTGFGIICVYSVAIGNFPGGKGYLKRKHDENNYGYHQGPEFSINDDEEKEKEKTEV